MDTIVMRERKSALIIGIICTLLFTAFGLFFAMIEAGIALLFFLPFILLGASVILIYYRHFIILETDRMTVSEPFRKKKGMPAAQYIRITLLDHTQLTSASKQTDLRKNLIRTKEASIYGTMDFFTFYEFILPFYNALAGKTISKRRAPKCQFCFQLSNAHVAYQPQHSRIFPCIHW